MYIMAELLPCPFCGSDKLKIEKKSRKTLVGQGLMRE